MKELSTWIKKLRSADSIRERTHKIVDYTSIYREGSRLLAAEGEGTICIRLEEVKAFNLDLIANNALLRLSVSEHNIKLYCIYRGRFILLKETHSSHIGLDNNPQCTYWLSFQASSRTIWFGKREPNFQNRQFSFTLPKSNKSPEQFWMNKIGSYRVDSPAVIYSTKNTIDPQEARWKERINLLSSKNLSPTCKTS